MENAIKKYEELIVVQTFDDKIYFVEVSNYEALIKKLETQKFVRFSQYETEKVGNIKRTYKKEIGDIEQGILTQSKNIQEELYSIWNERKKNMFKTKDFDHLWRIYKKR